METTHEEIWAMLRELIAALNWQGPLFEISALSGDGTMELVQALMTRLEAK